VPRESEPLTAIHEHEAMPHNANYSEEAEQKNPLDDARRDLREFCLMTIDQLELIEFLGDLGPAGDGLGKISKAVSLTFTWCMANEENTDMDLFRSRQRTLEQLVNPIMNDLSMRS